MILQRQALHSPNRICTAAGCNIDSLHLLPRVLFYFVTFFLGLATVLAVGLGLVVFFFFEAPPYTITGFSGEKASSMRLFPLLVRMTRPWWSSMH